MIISICIIIMHSISVVIGFGASSHDEWTLNRQRIAIMLIYWLNLSNNVSYINVNHIDDNDYLLRH